MQQQLAETRAAHERHMIEAEAARKSLEADALKQKSEELMQQKEALDRCAAPCHGLCLVSSAECDLTSALSGPPDNLQSFQDGGRLLCKRKEG